MVIMNEMHLSQLLHVRIIFFSSQFISCRYYVLISAWLAYLSEVG